MVAQVRGARFTLHDDGIYRVVEDDHGRSRVIFHDALNDMMDWLGITDRSTNSYNDTLAREKGKVFKGRR